MGGLGQDLRFAARTLAASPGFTAVAVLVLALGIGANAAIFTVVNAVLLRPPAAVADPAELVTVYTSDFSGPAFGTSSWPDYLDFRDDNEVLSGLAAHTPTPVSVMLGEETRRAFADVTSANYFDVLGVPLSLGRGFRPEEELPGARPVVILSHAFWTTALGGDPRHVGRPLSLNGHPFTVVGVAPPGFSGMLRGLQPDVWVLASASPLVAPGSDWLEPRGNRSFFLVGRLAPAATRDEVQARFSALARHLHEAHPESWTDVSGRPRRVTVVPEAESRVFPQVRRPVVGFLALLLGIVALVLLVACANLAGLLVSRAVSRRREIGIRLALGAGRPRLIRQLLTESALLSMLGAIGGTLVAAWAIGALAAVRLPVPVPVALDLSVDGRVLLFTTAVALVTGVVFGLAPALEATRRDVLPALKGEAGGRGGAGRLRTALLTAQVALSLVLLVGAGLLLRALDRGRAIDPGFDAERVAILSLEPKLVGYDAARAVDLYDRLLARVRSLPGVEDAAAAAVVPLGLGGWRRSLEVEGYEPAAGEEMEFHVNVVTPGYFQTMGIPVLRGRGFEERDRAGAPRVVVVNRAFAERFWGGDDPLGKRISLGDDELAEVVGVVRDTKHVTLGEAPRPVWYLPLAQEPMADLTLHVRANDPARIAETVRREVLAVDPRLPVFNVETLEAHLGLGLLPQRLAGGLLAGFGALALLLAAVGLYGVVAHSAARRTAEVALRMALGARATDVVRLVVRDAARAVSVGLLLGTLAATAASRVLSGLLFGAAALDPLVFAAVPLLLVTVALVGSWLPARRAARLQPARALRSE